MDETPICVFQGQAAGNLFITKRSGSHERPPRKHVPRGTTRSFLTLVTFLCDDAELQQFLPQIVIGNHSVFKAGEMNAHWDAAPDNVYLIRAKSHWTTGDIMMRITELLGAILETRRPNAYAMWFLDTAGSHLNQANLEYAFSLGMNMVPIPA